MKDAYRTFVQNIPFYGFACLCVDHPEVQRLISQISDRQIITYGFTPQAEITAQNIRAVPGLITFDVVVADSLSPTGKMQRMNGFSLPVYGRHNVLNALAAIGVGIRLGISEANLKKRCRLLPAFSAALRKPEKRTALRSLTITVITRLKSLRL